MNELYTLSKKRYAERLNDKEYKQARRQLLETNFGYDKHLKAVSATPEIASPSETNRREKNTAASPVKEKTQAIASAMPDKSTKSKAEKTASFAENFSRQSDANNPKKYMPIAAVVAVIVVVGIYLISSGSDESTEVVESTPATQSSLDLQSKFDDIVVSADYSDASLELFLSFWQLADEQQKQQFMNTLDNNILDSDFDESEKLSAIKSQINRSSNDLVQHSKKIVAGALNNEDFSFLTELWQQASPADKDIFIGFITSSYQNFIVDFESENKALAVEEIMNHLDILSLVQVSENKVPQQPIVANRQIQDLDTSSSLQQEVVSSTEPASTQQTLDKEVDTVKAAVVKVPTTTNKIANATPPAPTPSTNKVAQDSKTEDKSASDNSTVTANTAPQQSVELTSTQVPSNELIENSKLAVIQLLAKDSLREPSDANDLPSLFRQYYRELVNRNKTLGNNPKEAGRLAKEESFAVIESHPSFSFHYHDIEQYNTDIGQGDVVVEFTTSDSIKRLSTFFNNFERPPEP